jgi:hypothetical protein
MIKHLWQFGEPTTINFAGTTIDFSSHSLKISVTIQNWPFFELANSLAITMDALAMDNSPKRQSCVNYNEDEGNLLWYIVVINDVSLYQTKYYF